MECGAARVLSLAALHHRIVPPQRLGRHVTRSSHSYSGVCSHLSVRPEGRPRVALQQAAQRRKRGAARAADSDVATTSEVLQALPENFDLERAILLAGFAFEAYNQPKGGLKDSDVNGGSTSYFSPFVKECFSGVVEVKLIEAKGLASADFTGKSDPYVIASVGENSHRSGTKLFTLDPKWNETFRLYVRNPDEQVLRLRVMDADLIGSDDDIGAAAVALKDVAGGQRASLTLPVVDMGGGKGGGTISLEVQYYTFSPVKAALASASASASGFAGGLGTLGMNLLSNVVNTVSKGVDMIQAELQKRQWEQELWTVPPDSTWSLLASDSRPSSMPTDFEKVCFVDNVKTDTQVAVWRNVERKQIVVAFRGTEMAKLKDIATDARLAPRAFNTERVASGGFFQDLAQPQVHEGFLEAFDSIRPRLFRALDDAAGPPEAQGEGWHVFICGHSLGGALATLFAAELASSVQQGRRKCEISMYNYGSPRVGNRAFVDDYNILVPDSIRVVNGADAVVTVPALLGYRHVQHGVRICPKGTCAGEPLPAKLDGPAQSVAALAESIGASSFVDQETAAEAAVALASLVDSSALEAHFEDNYLVALRNALQLSATSRGE